ncbi:MAG: pilin [Patescibacteria group bacterium]
MKNLTTKKLVAGVMTLGVLSLLAVPVIVGAAGDVPKIGDLTDTLGEATLTDLIKSILQVILGFLGVIAVLIILWGGFIWMTAAGDDDKVSKAKQMIYSGIIGLVIIFAAYAIASFVFSNLQTITGANLENGASTTE